MKRLKFRNREERQAYMARRYLGMKKRIPWAVKPKRYQYSTQTDTEYKLGLTTKIQRFLSRALLLYPKVVAAGLIALLAYVFFQRANAITQWAGGLAMSTLAIANPEASIKMALRTHHYMSYGVEMMGEKLSPDADYG